jgi:hypothetical protein
MIACFLKYLSSLLLVYAHAHNTYARAMLILGIMALVSAAVDGLGPVIDANQEVSHFFLFLNSLSS